MTEQRRERWYDPTVTRSGPPIPAEPARDQADAGSPALAVTHSAATSQLIIDIATSAAGERDLDQILHEALDRLQTVSPLTGGSIALVEGDELIIRAAVGPFADEARSRPQTIVSADRRELALLFFIALGYKLSSRNLHHRRYLTQTLSLRSPAWPRIHRHPINNQSYKNQLRLGGERGAVNTSPRLLVIRQ